MCQKYAVMFFNLPYFISLVLFTFTISATGLAPNQTSPLLLNEASPPPTSNASDQAKQGWTSSPNGRGTLDIIWSCSFTMFLCSWSVLCLNIPGPGESRFKIFRRKLYITALAFLGPEFIFQIALGQWVSARRSVKDFHASGYTKWTMTHAFYVDMGGFILHTSDYKPFPIDAKQLHHLVTEGYVDLPTLGKHEIADKNKMDGMLRLITLFQITWFVVDLAGRRAQNLAITCGELTTAAFIVCSIGTTLFWLHKPADVAIPEILKTDVSLVEILTKAGQDPSQQYHRTPLDFISRKEWPWSLYWSNWINILRNLGIVFGPQTKPAHRFENTEALDLPGIYQWVFFGMSAVYGSIFLCGWNYSFPTHTELILWRAASTTMMGTLVAYWLITDYAFRLHPTIRRYLDTRKSRAHQIESNTPSGIERRIRNNPLYSTARKIAACVRNNSESQDPALTLPLKAILPMYIVGFFYCHARTYIFVGDIIQLRSLPASAFETVDWTQVLPHF